MKKFSYYLMMFVVFQMALVSAWADKSDCGEYPNQPAVVANEVGEDIPSVANDYDEIMAEMTGPGVTYLSVINGDQPVPNACGLNPSNDPAEWTGWGGPLNADNMTIGEGTGTRNEIVIGGVLFQRGVGTHAIAIFVYPLTGATYQQFHGYVGMSDEKDPDGCGVGGTCDFTFEVDGNEMFQSDVLGGTKGGENVEPVLVEFDIPGGAQELVITIGDGGDGVGCDHACLGDAKLLGPGAGAVEPNDKATTLWGSIKASY